MIKRYSSSIHVLIIYMYNFRVFVNRSLMLERVKFYGFDMDYTLASKCRHKKGVRDSEQWSELL